MNVKVGYINALWALQQACDKYLSQGGSLVKPALSYKHMFRLIKQEFKRSLQFLDVQVALARTPADMFARVSYIRVPGWKKTWELPYVHTWETSWREAIFHMRLVCNMTAVQRKVMPTIPPLYLKAWAAELTEIDNQEYAYWLARGLRQLLAVDPGVSHSGTHTGSNSTALRSQELPSMPTPTSRARSPRQMRASYCEPT